MTPELAAWIAWLADNWLLILLIGLYFAGLTVLIDRHEKRANEVADAVYRWRR